MKLSDLSAQDSIHVTIHSQFQLSPEHSHSVVSNAHSKQSQSHWHECRSESDLINELNRNPSFLLDRYWSLRSPLLHA